MKLTKITLKKGFRDDKNYNFMVIVPCSNK